MMAKKGTHEQRMADWQGERSQSRTSRTVDPDSLVGRRQDRTAAGLELSGPLLGMGFWCEGNYNWMEEEEDFARVVAGLDYTFGGGTYVMLEGLFNGRAEDSTPYPAHDWLANLLYGEPVGPGWIMLGVREDLSALSNGSFYLFGSPDESLLLKHRLDIAIAQNADLTLY